MGKQTSQSTVIPHSCEVWQGILSIPRIEELLSVGLKIQAVAEKFGVTRHTITKTLKKKKPTADTVGESTTPEGAAVSAEIIARSA